MLLSRLGRPAHLGYRAFIAPRARAVLAAGALALAAACEQDLTPPPEQQLPAAAARISTGSAFSCALDSAGAAYCWGSNVTGALGVGSENETGRPAPQPVAGGHTFTALTSGNGHTCALERDSTAYCWGHGGSGALGAGTNANAITPARVAGDLKFVALAAGSSHTCALSAAGAAYCWGSNSFGALGLGSVAQQSFVSPQPVTGGLTFRSIAAGGGHTCAVGSDGVAYCWGFNGSGQLGLGTDAGASGVPAPRPIMGGLRFASVSAGNSTTCGMTLEGAPYCWGENIYGQLGNDTTVNSPAPVQVRGGLAFVQIVTGFHTCGVTDAGAAYCWGSDTHGQLGTGAASPTCFVNQADTLRSVGPCERRPAAVAGGHPFREVRVSRSGRHTCGATPDGRVFCWGRNDQGQLGDGTTNNRALPVRVVLP